MLDEIEELKAKKICCDCVGETYLKESIQNTGKKRKCSYCGLVEKSLTIGTVSDLVEKAFRSFYSHTNTEPTEFEYAMLRHGEATDPWYREGTPVVLAIEEAADIPEKAANDIQQILEVKNSYRSADEIGEETEFAEDSHYERNLITDEKWDYEWQIFEHSIKTEARMFNQKCEKYLHAVFDGVDLLKTKAGMPVIIKAGPRTRLQSLYRARTFQSNDSLKQALSYPDIHLGPPASKLTRAGRMNGTGISVFYGSNKPESALAEVRPPVGSKVAVTQFKIIRPIRLLDLQALNSIEVIGSIFDSTYVGALEKAAFLRSLSRRIAVPVMPDDENFGYLATQAIADYLSMNERLNVDGIIYPSIQLPGKSFNVVLFHKASKVEPIKLVEGTKVSVDLYSIAEDGFEDDIIVVEEVPKAKLKDEETEFLKFWDLLPDPTKDLRLDTLSVDLSSIKVHDVKSAHFKTRALAVSRFEFERPDESDILDN